MQAELDSPLGPPRPCRLRRDCGSRSLRQCRTHSTACPWELAEDAAVPTPFCGFRRYRSTCSGWGPMSNHVEQVPMRAGADRDAEGAPMFVDCMLKLPAWPLLNPLVAAIGHVHVCPRASHPIECRVSTGPAQCLRAPRFQELAVLIKLGDARNALAVGTRTSPAAFQVTAVGRAAKVKVIVGSAGVHRTGSPAPPPAPTPPTRCPGLPRRRLQGHRGRVRLRPSVQSARMRPIGPESRSAGHDCSQAGEALGREREPAVVRCMRPIGLCYAQG